MLTHGRLLFVRYLGVSALKLLLRHGFVVLASDFGLVAMDIHFGGVCASLSNLLLRHLQSLYFVAIQEVSNRDPSFLVSGDLISEEVVPGEVSIAEVVLDLLAQFGG